MWFVARLIVWRLLRRVCSACRAGLYDCLMMDQKKLLQNVFEFDNLMLNVNKWWKMHTNMSPSHREDDNDCQIFSLLLSPRDNRIIGMCLNRFTLIHSDGCILIYVISTPSHFGKRHSSRTHNIAMPPRVVISLVFRADTKNEINYDGFGVNTQVFSSCCAARSPLHSCCAREKRGKICIVLHWHRRQRGPIGL